MSPGLRDEVGGPRLRTRLLALLMILGLVAAAAPLVVVPLVTAVWRSLT